MNTSIINLEFSRKELLELKNKVNPTSKIAKKIMAALAEKDEPEDWDDESEEDEFGRKFHLNSDD